MRTTNGLPPSHQMRQLLLAARCLLKSLPYQSYLTARVQWTLQLMHTLGHITTVLLMISISVCADMVWPGYWPFQFCLKPRGLSRPLLDAPSFWSVHKGVFSVLIIGWYLFQEHYSFFLVSAVIQAIYLVKCNHPLHGWCLGSTGTQAQALMIIGMDEASQNMVFQ